MTAYFEEPPEEVPLELGPPIEPLAPGEVVPLAPGEVEVLECGAELLPDELLGPQSSIAVLSLLLLMPVPLLLELVPLLLAPGLLEAELLLPGGQSFLDMLPDVPDVAPALVPDDVPLVPALVPDLLSAPVVLLVCAIAAVPRVSAIIEAAVRRRRFIRCPPCDAAPPPDERPPGTLDR